MHNIATITDAEDFLMSSNYIVEGYGLPLYEEGLNPAAEILYKLLGKPSFLKLTEETVKSLNETEFLGSELATHVIIHNFPENKDNLKSLQEEGLVVPRMYATMSTDLSWLQINSDAEFDFSMVLMHTYHIPTREFHQTITWRDPAIAVRRENLSEIAPKGKKFLDKIDRKDKILGHVPPADIIGTLDIPKDNIQDFSNLIKQLTNNFTKGNIDEPFIADQINQFVLLNSLPLDADSLHFATSLARCLCYGLFTRSLSEFINYLKDPKIAGQSQPGIFINAINMFKLSDPLAIKLRDIFLNEFL